MHNLKSEIGINWNFENDLFLFTSSDSCHKKDVVRITDYSFKYHTAKIKITPVAHEINPIYAHESTPIRLSHSRKHCVVLGVQLYWNNARMLLFCVFFEYPLI